MRDRRIRDGGTNVQATGGGGRDGTYRRGPVGTKCHGMGGWPTDSNSLSQIPDCNMQMRSTARVHQQLKLSPSRDLSARCTVANMVPPPKRVDAVNIQNTTAHPLKFTVVYDNHKDKVG